MTRFLGFFYKAWEQLPLWSASYIGYSYYAITSGSLDLVKWRGKMNSMPQIAIAAGSADQEDDNQNLGMAAQNRAMTAKVRGICSSGLELALFILGDSEIRTSIQILTRMTTPLVEWHSQLAAQLRDVEANRDWCIRACTGELMKPLAVAGNLLADNAALQTMGFNTCLVPGTAHVSHVFQKAMGLAN